MNCTFLQVKYKAICQAKMLYTCNDPACYNISYYDISSFDIRFDNASVHLQVIHNLSTKLSTIPTILITIIQSYPHYIQTYPHSKT